MASELSSVQSIHDFTVKDGKGNDVELSKYKGKVLLIVNVASQCGLTTSNYTELAELYQKYKDQDTAPLYKYLKSVKGDEIEWNFAKFLVDKDGKLVERYAPITTPLTFEGNVQCNVWILCVCCNDE
ncbi:hypothetical protein AgCh_023548 [Apium graveolens]